MLQTKQHRLLSASSSNLNTSDGVKVDRLQHLLGISINANDILFQSRSLQIYKIKLNREEKTTYFCSWWEINKYLREHEINSYRNQLFITSGTKSSLRSRSSSCNFKEIPIQKKHGQTRVKCESRCKIPELSKYRTMSL